MNLSSQNYFKGKKTQAMDKKKCQCSTRQKNSIFKGK